MRRPADTTRSPRTQGRLPSRPGLSPAKAAAIGLLRTADLIRRHLARVVEPERITFQQYNVLRILRGARGQPLSALDIGERLIEATPGVSRLIDRLVAKGLVRRERSRSDRRLLECVLTDEGERLLSRLDGAMDRADAQLLGPLGEARTRTLIALLEAIRRSQD